MSRETNHVAALVAAVSDGEPVDWDSAAERMKDDDERALVGSLRLVAQVAAAHRGLDLFEAFSAESTRTLGQDAESSAQGAAPSGPCRRWGPLEIVQKIGEGAFGEVFRARDPRLDHEVALKLLRSAESRNPDVASAVLEEGRLLARVRHPNVATVHGASEHDGRVGLWMELVRGRTLAQLLRDQGPLGAREAANIGLDLCRALTAIHNAGVVHRDIKAQNVMREEGGRILLMDFGAGREVVEGKESAEGVSGTPLYMAPEVLLEGVAHARSDIYSLAVLLFHLVTEEFPVQCRSLAELREKLQRGEMRLLREARPDLPEGFLRVVERALASRPEERFPSAGHMEQALADFLGVKAPVPPHVPWRKVVYVAASVAIVGVAAALVVSAPWKDREQRRDEGATTGGVPPGTVPAAGTAEWSEHLVKLYDRAGLYQALGSYAEAKLVLGQAVAGSEQAFGLDDPSLADSLVRLAWVHQSSGESPQARALYERAVVILASKRGPTHPDVATALLGLGSLLREMGELRDARERLVEALAIREQTQGRDGRGAADVLDELARVEIDAGDPAAAGPLLERSAAIHAGFGGGAGPRVETSLERLGDRALGVPYTVEAALYRSRHGAKERLENGDRVAPDDRLFVEFRATKPLHVYVINEDEKGEANLLFPLPGFDLANPLAPFALHRLPGRRLEDGAKISWQVSSAGGREHFLVVASPDRLLEFEEELRGLALPEGTSFLVAHEMSTETTGRLRGIARLAVEPEDPALPATGDATGLFQLARRLASGEEKVRGVWIRQLDLENPGFREAG